MSSRTLSVREDFFEQKLVGKKAAALTAAIVKAGGSLIMSDGKVRLELVFADKMLAFYLIDMLSPVVTGEIQLDRESTEGISKGRYIMSFLPHDSLRVLSYCGIAEVDGDNIVSMSDDVVGVPADEAFACFVRGLFWVRGNLSAPSAEDENVSGSKGACRAEIGGLDTDLALAVQHRLNSGVVTEAGVAVSIALNAVTKQDKTTLYTSSMETICNLLAFMGATNTVLAFNDLIMVRQIRNSVNRQINFELSNSNKRADAAAKQIDAIHRLQSSHLWATLDEGLILVATLRLADPEANVRQLAERSGLSRSGVYHRLAKLVELAESLDQA